uniref:Uncharacterized protein n=1 Tax=Arundo donax TaxID=35708 RepID=A0A0A8YW66_ARUDO
MGSSIPEAGSSIFVAKVLSTRSRRRAHLHVNRHVELMFCFVFVVHTSVVHSNFVVTNSCQI